jgi:uncharacterized protein YeaO (DUF488 family)
VARLDRDGDHRVPGGVKRACAVHASRHCEAGRAARSAAGVAARKEQSVVLRVVRLGSARVAGEGTRIGTVRRPPRGVPKSEFASQNWYDVWFPNLAPSVETMKLGQQAGKPAQWAAFARRYRSEMSAPEHAHAIALLATLSHQANFSVGCYCENEAHCHRSILRELLLAQGANLAPNR